MKTTHGSTQGSELQLRYGSGDKVEVLRSNGTWTEALVEAVRMPNESFTFQVGSETKTHRFNVACYQLCLTDKRRKFVTLVAANDELRHVDDVEQKDVVAAAPDATGTNTDRAEEETQAVETQATKDDRQAAAVQDSVAVEAEFKRLIETVSPGDRCGELRKFDEKNYTENLKAFFNWMRDSPEEKEARAKNEEAVRKRQLEKARAEWEKARAAQALRKEKEEARRKEKKVQDERDALNAFFCGVAENANETNFVSYDYDTRTAIQVAKEQDEKRKLADAQRDLAKKEKVLAEEDFQKKFKKDISNKSMQKVFTLDNGDTYYYKAGDAESGFFSSAAPLAFDSLWELLNQKEYDIVFRQIEMVHEETLPGISSARDIFKFLYGGEKPLITQDGEKQESRMSLLALPNEYEGCFLYLLKHLVDYFCLVLRERDQATMNEYDSPCLWFARASAFYVIDHEKDWYKLVAALDAKGLKEENLRPMQEFLTHAWTWHCESKRQVVYRWTEEAAKDARRENYKVKKTFDYVSVKAGNEIPFELIKNEVSEYVKSGWISTEYIKP